jgi:hypothetical protein
MSNDSRGGVAERQLGVDLWSRVMISGLAIVWFIVVPGLTAYWWLFGAARKALPDEFSHLLANIPSLWWPMIALMALLLFRTELPLLFRRVRKWEGFGQKLELEPQEIEQIGREIQEAQQELAEQPKPPSVEGEQPTKVDADEAEVLEAARINPRLALLRLSAALERALNELSSELRLTRTGRRVISARQIVDQLVEVGALSTNARTAFADFWPIRNQIAHGLDDPPDAVVLQLLDVGLSLLRLLRSVPRTISRVIDVVTVYTDPEATIPADGVQGIMLQVQMEAIMSQVKSDEVDKLIRVFPTTKPYERGRYVTWAWNMTRVFDEMWYRDKTTGAIQTAWLKSAEFIGRQVGNDDVPPDGWRPS